MGSLMSLDGDSLACPWEDKETSTDSDVASTISLTDEATGASSYIQLFGRRYRHWVEVRENNEQYFCPADDLECERQDIQHHALLLLLDNKLHLAPISESPTAKIQVLDVCTGDGIWAIDLADAFPHWEVVGVDWSPMQPSFVPPNVRFELADMRQLPWCYNPGQFDYIHTRGTIYTGCWKDFKVEAIDQAFQCLRPGGWFESQEIGRLVACDDGTLPADSNLASWARILEEAAALKNRPRDGADKMAQWYKEAGFVDVQCTLLKMPIGSWPKDEKMKQIGCFWRMCLELGWEGLSLRLLKEAFGWELPEMMLLLSRVKQDIKNRSIHSYTEVYVVCGRKPTPGELGSVEACNSATTGGEQDVPSSMPACDEEAVSLWLTRSEAHLSGSIDISGGHEEVAPEGNSNEENNNSGDPWTVPPPLAGGMSVDPSLFRHLPQVSVVNFSPLDIKAPETQLTKEAPQQQYQHPQPSVQEQPGLRSYEFGAGTAAAGAPVASSGCPSAPGLAHGDGTGNIGDGGDRRRKGRGLSGFSADTTKRLACPYYKRNPRKYCTWTSCPGPGWDEIHRVKAHLYKRHALPPQCPRCWEPFHSDSSYREHLQQDPPCAVRAMQRNVLDGFTKEQEELLRSRRRTRPDNSPADKWREMYMLLFPGDDIDSIPSPYYEHTDDAKKTSSDGKEDCAEFLRREMPIAASQELDLMFQDGSGFRDMELVLRPRIEQLLADLQLRLLRTCLSSETEKQGGGGVLETGGDRPGETRDYAGKEASREQDQSDPHLPVVLGDPRTASASDDCSRLPWCNTSTAGDTITHTTIPDGDQIIQLPPPPSPLPPQEAAAATSFEIHSAILETAVEQQEGLLCDWDSSCDPSMLSHLTAADDDTYTTFLSLAPTDDFFDFGFDLEKQPVLDGEPPNAAVTDHALQNGLPDGGVDVE